MKKALSLLLAVLLIFTCFSTTLASAESKDMGKCVCTDCTKTDGCKCCVYCPYLDQGYVVSCVTWTTNENGEKVAVFCCGACEGIWPCNCNCGCEYCEDKYQKPDSGNGLPILDEDTQKVVVNAFQLAMQKVAAVFDMIFNAIFKFLRINELFPDLFD